MTPSVVVVGGSCNLCKAVILNRDEVIVWMGACNEVHYFHRSCLKRLAVEV